MEFRKATETEAIGVMQIIEQAQAYFKEAKVNQWQNNYPNLDTIKGDINKGNSYVLLKNGILVGTVAVIFDGEKAYDRIYDGKWLSRGPFAVIHRLAVDSNYKGLGLSQVILKSIEKLCYEKDIHSIKVDTHKGNMSMQAFLKKSGFQYCGIIYLEDGNERVAFEKTLK